MEEHFKNGIPLQQVTFEVKGLPDGVSFDDLDGNQRRLIMGRALQPQIQSLQGDKVALKCMGRISLYDTYDEAFAVGQKIVGLTYQIFVPPGQKITPHERFDVYAIKEDENFGESPR